MNNLQVQLFHLQSCGLNNNFNLTNRTMMDFLSPPHFPLFLTYDLPALLRVTIGTQHKIIQREKKYCCKEENNSYFENNKYWVYQSCNTQLRYRIFWTHSGISTTGNQRIHRNKMAATSKQYILSISKLHYSMKSLNLLDTTSEIFHIYPRVYT